MSQYEQRVKTKNVPGKSSNSNKAKEMRVGLGKKRKWTPQQKIFEGSVKEGQGFAFKRKQKFKYDYNKLLRKEKKKPGPQMLYKNEYPEHLKHLYMAEEEKLNKEAWENRVNRTKMRMVAPKKDTEKTEAAEEASGGDEVGETVPEVQEQAVDTEKESLPVSNRMKKKLQKKTSYQKTKEEFERIREKRRKKKEDYLKDKQQREEAIKRYKQKKIETFQMLSKKTKKGQPNLNLQMEYLLQKIQGNK